MFMFSNFKVAVVARTLVRLHSMRTKVRATLKKFPNAYLNVQEFQTIVPPP